LRATADSLGTVPPAAAAERVRKAYLTLVENVLPHEQAEQNELYPMLNRLLGGTDATATMSRAHAEIAHQVRRLGRRLTTSAPVRRRGRSRGPAALLYSLRDPVSCTPRGKGELSVTAGARPARLAITGAGLPNRA
jgi:hypothetical protein